MFKFIVKGFYFGRLESVELFASSFLEAESLAAWRFECPCDFNVLCVRILKSVRGSCK